MKKPQQPRVLYATVQDARPMLVLAFDDGSLLSIPTDNVAFAGLAARGVEVKAPQ